MKNLFTIITIIFSVSISFSQNDFETRYYTIGPTSLVVPTSIESVIDEMPDKINSSFTLGEAPSYQNTLNTNAISPSNYWQPVDIAMAMASNTIAYNNSQFDTSRLKEKQFGFSIQGNGGNTSFEFSDGQTRVRNDVYKEQGMPFLQNRYQRPYYRTNPFRVNRGVYYGN